MNENKVYTSKSEVTAYINSVPSEESSSMKAIVNNVVQMIRDKHL